MFHFLLDIPQSTKFRQILLMKTLKACFILPHVFFPFREQFQNESTPHILKYIQYQFGEFNNRKAIRYYYNKQPVRLAYSDLKDPFLAHLMRQHPSYTKFPPLPLIVPPLECCGN